MGQLNEQQQGIRRRPRGERGRLRPFIRSATEEASHKGAGQCAPHVGTTSQDQIKPSMTSGIKISTYSALLIRPYYAAGSPLLRELYALGQAIGLLAESFQKLATPWRRPGVKIHRRPCGAVRRPWEHSLPLVSLGASSKRHHHQNARGPQAQEDRPQKPGIQYWRAVVALSRTRERRSPVREGEEGNGKGRGKGKAKVAAGKPREMPAVGERTRLIAGLACAVAIEIGGWSPCFS